MKYVVVFQSRFGSGELRVLTIDLTNVPDVAWPLKEEIWEAVEKKSPRHSVALQKAYFIRGACPVRENGIAQFLHLPQ